jgi:hypothetical protein
MTPAQLITNLKSLNVHEEIQRTLIDTKDKVVQLQKVQLFSGIKSDETPILPPYTASYAAYKRSIGLPSNRVTLFLRGDVYAGIFARVEQDTIFEDSTDSKAQKLYNKYGEKVMGLGGEKRGEYIQDIEPLFLNNIRLKIGL